MSGNQDMKSVIAILILYFVSSLTFARAGQELPAWDETNEAREYYLGGGLWPSGLLPSASQAATQSPATAEGQSQPVEDEKFVMGPPDPATLAKMVADAGSDAGNKKFYGPADAGTLAGGDMADASLQRVRENPDGTYTVPEEVVDEQAYEPLPPLEGELAKLYFSQAPTELLIDPQHLLTEQKSNDIMRFLEFQAEESKIRIYVMVIGENQKLPEGVDLHALHQKWFDDSPVVLMLYYRERPEMTELVFNDSIRNSLPETVFERIRQTTLRQGSVTDLAPDQVEKMTIELSIQLYWMGRLMEQEKETGKGIASTGKASEMAPSSDAPEFLREYAPGIFLDESGKVFSIILTGIFILGGLAALGCIGWILMWWRTREGLSGEPLLFPEFRIDRRLGGEFCGGSFVSMSFDMNESL